MAHLERIRDTITLAVLPEGRRRVTGPADAADAIGESIASGGAASACIIAAQRFPYNGRPAPIRRLIRGLAGH